MLRILQNKHLYFPVVELYKNFNALPPLKLHELQILMLLHKFIHHSDILNITAGTLVPSSVNGDIAI